MKRVNKPTVKQAPKMENTFTPVTPNIMKCMRFWRNQSLTDCKDKGGSFNLELYLDYLSHQ